MTGLSVVEGGGQEPEPRLILVGCGGRKAPRKSPPVRLYTGSYFSACMGTGLAMVRPGTLDRVMILSAKYGLLGLWLPQIEPYDLRLGQPGAVTCRYVHAQAVVRWIHTWPVVALCGAAYATLARQVWETVDTPLAGLGIGQQMAKLKAMREGHG